MINRVIKNNVLNTITNIAKIEKEKNIKFPPCIGILYQPKRKK